VKGSTPTQIESIRRQEMLEEIQQIQETHTHLPLFARNLITRDIVSLRAMTTKSISAYLYGTKKVVEAARAHGKDLNQRTLQQFITS
jgi:citrate lyase beta subunit